MGSGEGRGGGKQQARGIGWLQAVEVLWDLPDLLAAHDKRTLAEPAVGEQRTKLAGLLVSWLSPSTAAAALLSGACVRRLVGASLAALHAHVPTRQLFSLLDSLHLALTAKAHPVPAKLYGAPAALSCRDTVTTSLSCVILLLAATGLRYRGFRQCTLEREAMS